MFLHSKRRITEQMLSHWNGLRGAKKWPAAEQIVKADIPALWEDILIVKVKQQGGKFSYEPTHTGRNIAAMLQNAALELQQGLDQKFEAAFRSGNYAQDEGIYTSRTGFRIKYRRIILPLGAGDAAVDHLLCAMRHTVEESGA